MTEIKKILVVEDDVSLLTALHDKLATEGFSVLDAKNGVEGLEIATHDHPDLILLDILMPEMDGLTMLKKLRETLEGKKTEVIVLTNLSDNEKLSQALALGSYEFLVKADWKIQDIVKKIRDKLNK
jgi:CheY-like chemotaxis protein